MVTTWLIHVLYESSIADDHLVSSIDGQLYMKVAFDCGSEQSSVADHSSSNTFLLSARAGCGF